jgi:hypothetical protein
MAILCRGLASLSALSLRLPDVDGRMGKDVKVREDGVRPATDVDPCFHADIRTTGALIYRTFLRGPCAPVSKPACSNDYPIVRSAAANRGSSRYATLNRQYGDARSPYGEKMVPGARMTLSLSMAFANSMESS